MAEQTEELLEQDDDAPLRWYVVATLVLVVVVGFGVALWCFLDWTSTCSDKGLGVSAAGDSSRASLCQRAHGAAVLVVPVGWLVGLALAGWAVVSWGGGALRTLLCGVLLLTPVALPAAAFGALHLSGTDCSERELAAYRQWAGSGGQGRPPYDCRTF